MIAIIVLLIVNILIFINTKEDSRLKEVKERYKKLRDHLSLFVILRNPEPRNHHILHRILRDHGKYRDQKN